MDPRSTAVDLTAGFYGESLGIRLFQKPGDVINHRGLARRRATLCPAAGGGQQ